MTLRTCFRLPVRAKVDLDFHLPVYQRKAGQIHFGMHLTVLFLAKIASEIDFDCFQCFYEDWKMLMVANCRYEDFAFSN